MIKEEIENFDWSKYDGKYKGGNKLSPNLKIEGQTNKEKCYSREPYAQKLFDIYTSKTQPIVKKDLIKGDCVPITNIYNIRDGKAIIELLGGLTVDIDLEREKKFIQLFGYNNIDEFILVLQDPDHLSNFINQQLYAYVIENTSVLKISLWQGHIKKSKDEFMEEIKSPSRAYVAKIIEANKGGFFVEVQGVEAFMPGSLAAANKIMDFHSMVGAEVIVMIEDYLKDMNSFIVSHKKYIEHVLPRKIQELDIDKEYRGNITGTSKYGIFIEFNEIFTGLLHHSKMKDDTRESFSGKLYSPGDEISFFIGEITRDNRIILTEENPVEKREKLSKFVKENSNKILESEVVALVNFGIIVNVENGISGLIPSKEFRKSKVSFKNFIVSDKIFVQVDEFKNNKITFKLTDENV